MRREENEVIGFAPVNMQILCFSCSFHEGNGASVKARSHFAYCIMA